MTRRVLIGFLFVLGLLGQALLGQTTSGQTTDEDYKVYTDSPRLFLRPQRARLLKRERERESIRWRQFDSLTAGGALMPEPGFAYGLYYFVTGDATYGKKAAEWATSPSGTDARQLALIYDWCQSALSPAQKSNIFNKLKRIALQTGLPKNTLVARDRVLAATAIATEEPELAERCNRLTVRDWFRGKVVPSLKEGVNLVGRDDMHLLYEIMHVLRDNTSIDLREDAKEVFKDLPVWHLLSHYPATYPGAENEYRIPVYTGAGEPDLKVAMLSRTAELMMVSYDNNALESQYMQGWLMQDRFLLRSTLGIPYEFMWANPYQPGLPYFKLNPFFHDKNRGILFVRSSWEDDARWFGYFEGQIQLFEDGQVRKAKLDAFEKPFQMGGSVIQAAHDVNQFKAGSEEGPSAVFFLGLKPRELAEVEVDDEEMEEVAADPGGILVLQFHSQPPTGVRMRRMGVKTPNGAGPTGR
jgi:hypothetical protein